MWFKGRGGSGGGGNEGGGGSKGNNGGGVGKVGGDTGNNIKQGSSSNIGGLQRENGKFVDEKDRNDKAGHNQGNSFVLCT